MKKLLLKLFLPSAEDMAKMAAQTVAKFVNSSDKQATIAKWGKIANDFTAIQAKVTGWLVDGTMDEEETEELKRALLPLAEKIRTEVKS